MSVCAVVLLVVMAVAVFQVNVSTELYLHCIFIYAICVVS